MFKTQYLGHCYLHEDKWKDTANSTHTNAETTQSKGFSMTYPLCYEHMQSMKYVPKTAKPQVPSRVWELVWLQ